MTFLRSSKLIAVIASLTCLPSIAATVVDGSSPELAAYSAKQIRENGFFMGNTLYWIDEQMGDGSPRQIYCDMTTGGGGWTLGMVSKDSDPLPSFTIAADSGTAGYPFSPSGPSFTADLSYLGLDQPASFLYDVRDSGGSSVFLGWYSGAFNATTPSFTVFNDFAGLNGQIDLSFDFHRPDRNYTVAIYVRESITPAPRLVPEPASLSLLGLAFAGALAHRRRRA